MLWDGAFAHTRARPVDREGGVNTGVNKGEDVSNAI